MKEGVDKSGLALARMRVVGTKNCLYGTSGLRDWNSDDCNGIS